MFGNTSDDSEEFATFENISHKKWTINKKTECKISKNSIDFAFKQKHSTTTATKMNQTIPMQFT